MNKANLKEAAYKQQVGHLAQAQTQALKILIEQQKPYKLTVDGALQYLDLVKTRLGPQLFPEFMQIMRENRDPNCDCMVIISKICRLFQNYPELLQGFGMFLPPNINLQVQTAGRFLIKAEKNDDFLFHIKTESMDRNDSFDWQNKSTESTLTAVSESDSTMDDNEDFEKASNVSREIEAKEGDVKEIDAKEIDTKEAGKKEVHTKEIDVKEVKTREIEAKEVDREVDANFAVNYLNKVKIRFQDQPEVYSKFLELLESVRLDCLGEQGDIDTDAFMEVCDLFKNNDDLIEEFKTFVPRATFPEPYELTDEAHAALELRFQNEDSFDSSDEYSRYYNPVNDPSIAGVGKYGSFEEHLFFDKVRKALYHKEVYNNFLRCLMLFTEDVVTKSELLKIATSFLGKFPDLLKQFKDILGFKESGHNIEAIPIKIIKYENLRLDPEIALDIDYATGGRNGASYRALPKVFKQPVCSGRTQLCKEVLNDTWVSFPSWSEDSTFVTSCKTEFEEMIYRCEDERFELDMAIRANSYTIAALENVQKKINKMTPEEKSVFSLDDTLGGSSTVLHQKALHRCYGDKTDELVEGLKRNPVVAVPIILKRLRGKEEEWKEKQNHFNHVWREQIDNYYIKSLDHQGINFKQNDSKSFRSKSLLNEMEMVFAEKKENSGVNFTPHFLLEFKETCVFLDAINLICQYLKKLPGIIRDDRRRIELLVRSFFPDFFCFPKTTIAAEAVDDEEEEEVEEQPQEAMDLDNDNDERSGHTSPTGSDVKSKDEEFSDPEESNSVEENEVSDESDKNSFIEDSDIFDKLDTILPTNLPYTLFFVSKHWYVFFRQFHILCERLSRLLHESTKKDVSPSSKTESGGIEKETPTLVPSYTELIFKLSQLLSGAIDYSQFEDEARSLFGIHAFVSFTMDKLILNIVRQLQQIVGDDMCKQCTAFFFHHNKIIVNGNYSSPMESLQIENEYLKKVERIMNEEKCFKVLWHKKDRTLTIELIEHEIEHIENPYEVEKWSNYLDAYLTEDNVSDELLSDAPGLPVFLPRNLRRQMEYWKRKVARVENIWKKRHSPTYVKKNLPLLCKRKAYFQSSPTPSKISHLPKAKLNESSSAKSDTSAEVQNVTEPCEIQKPELETSEKEKTVENDDKYDDNSKSLEEDTDNDKETLETEMEIEESVPELDVSENSNMSFEMKCMDSESVLSFSEEDDSMCCNISETSNDDSFSQLNSSFSGSSGKSDSDDIDGSEENDCIQEQSIDSVAAFHDITDEDDDDDDAAAAAAVAEDATQEKSEEVEVITVDSGDDTDIVCETDSVDKNEKVVESRPRREKASKRKKDTRARHRRSRVLAEYVRRRNKRNAARAYRERRARINRTEEEFYDPTFDYAYFSELSEEDKCSYLASKHLLVIDNVEGTFKRENFKLFFVQNCDLCIYRLNCLQKAKEIHQQVCEIKTFNFNAWHRVWLDRYVTPSMLKFCSDWLLKSDPEKFKLVCITMSDCIKPPYIPYSKYRVRYYKNTDS